MSKSNWKAFIEDIYCKQDDKSSQIILNVKSKAIDDYLHYINDNMDDNEDDFNEVEYFIDWLDEECKFEKVKVKDNNKEDGEVWKTKKRGLLTGEEVLYLKDVLRPYLNHLKDRIKNLWCVKSSAQGKLIVSFTDEHKKLVPNTIDLPIFYTDGSLSFSGLQSDVLYDLFDSDKWYTVGDRQFKQIKSVKVYEYEP